MFKLFCFVINNNEKTKCSKIALIRHLKTYTDCVSNLTYNFVFKLTVS